MVAERLQQQMGNERIEEPDLDRRRARISFQKPRCVAIEPNASARTRTSTPRADRAAERLRKTRPVASSLKM